MKFSIFFLCTFLLGGCASSQFSKHDAKYSSLEDQASPPLFVTSRFNSQLCSRYFGYVNFSVVNPSGDWKRLDNVSLGFPFSNSQFEVVEGKKLKAWADAISRQSGRDNHNAQLANLASGILGLGLLEKGNSSQKKMGVAVLAGRAVAASSERISNQRETAETQVSSHILANDVDIPPGMDKQYWILLRAKNDAPLLGDLVVNYDDENGVKHSFITHLKNWRNCSWQQARKNYLNQESNKMVFTVKSSVIGEASRVSSSGGVTRKMDAYQTEVYLRQSNNRVSENK